MISVLPSKMVGGGKKKFKRSRRKGKKRTPAPPWIELPIDVTVHILQRLDAVDIIESAQKVCTTWRRVCQDPALWRVIHMRNSDDLEMDLIRDLMCRHAVDRSQGQLIDLEVEYFASNELMEYVSHRSSNLRRLVLANSYNITGDCLSEAVKSFPKLEELSLILCSNSLINCGPLDGSCPLETIGKSCPLLKSFTLIEHGNHSLRGVITDTDDEFMDEIKDDEYAMAVAKTMPNLQKLVLVANDMTNVGLQAVLDGCPFLESLDIRECSFLDLKGALGERCLKQIKHLKLPSESTKDIGYDFCEEPNASSDNYYDDYFGYC